MNKTNYSMADEKIEFGENHEYASLITANNISIFPSGSVSKEKGADIKLGDVIDHCWSDEYYTGNNFCIHKDREYICYGIKSKSNLIKILNVKNGLKNSIHLLNGPARDIKFAYTSAPIFLSILDMIGNVFVYKLEQNGVFTDRLDVELLLTILKKNSAVVYTMSWCPFVPTKLDQNMYYDFSYILVISNGNEVMLWDMHNLPCENSSGIINFEFDIITIKAEKTITETHYSPEGNALAVVCSNGVVLFFQVDITDRNYSELLHKWEPYNGKPVTMLYFLNSIKLGDTAKYWRYAITGSMNNTKLKVWCCNDWSVLYNIQLQNNHPPTRKLLSHLDSDTCLLFLHDQNNGNLFTFRLLEERKEPKNDDCCMETLRLHHVAEFVFPFSLDSYSVVDVEQDMAISSATSNHALVSRLTIFVIYSHYVRYCALSYKIPNGIQTGYDTTMNSVDNELERISSVPSSPSLNGYESVHGQLNDLSVSNKDDLHLSSTLLQSDVKNNQKLTVDSKETINDVAVNADPEQVLQKTVDCTAIRVKRTASAQNNIANDPLCSRLNLIQLKHLEDLKHKMNILKSVINSQHVNIKVLTDLKDFVLESFDIILKLNEQNIQFMLSNMSKENQIITQMVSSNIKNIMIAEKLTDGTFAQEVQDSCKEFQFNIPNCRKDVQQSTIENIASDNQAVTFGTSDTVSKTLRLIEKFKKELTDTISKKFEDFQKNMTNYLNEVFTVFDKFEQDVKESRNVDALVDSLNQTLVDMDKKIKHIDDVISGIQPQVMNANMASVEEQRNSLSKFNTTLDMETVNIKESSTNDQIKAAFIKALEKNDANLLIDLCKKIDLNTVFSSDANLFEQQHLITLLPMLSRDLVSYTELKLSAMEAAVLLIEKQNSNVKNNLPAIVNDLEHSFSTFVTEYHLRSDDLIRFKLLIKVLSYKLNSPS